MPLARRFLPPLSLAVFALAIVAVLWAAGPTLGYDYQAYLGAAGRLVDGQPLYDATVAAPGPFAIYLYPPPFAVAFIPFVWLPGWLALAIWTSACVGMVAMAIAIVPVRIEIRWILLLMAGLDWPVLYAIKLGQVGPLLLLLFAGGWRWLDRPAAVGATIGIGALVKVQPALLFGWALLTRRWRLIGSGGAVLAGLSIITLPIVGLDAWVEFLRLLGRVGSPITTPHNFSPGAVAFQAGLAPSGAAAVQTIATLGALAIAAFASLRRPPEVGFLATMVASQLVSPLLWDHYAILLLLPAAWLLDRGHWWAILIPIATSVLFVSWIAPVAYPLVFAIAMIAPIVAASPRR